MKVLIVKTSSLGDVFHTLPAIEDAWRQVPGIEFHWLVEEAFADIPSWHPAVTRVIPVAWRRWRKQLFNAEHRQQMAGFLRQLREQHYDVVIDAQGLIKSALFTRLAKGPRYGLNKHSCREPLAALAYQHPQPVAKGQHAIPRVRQLLSQVLEYTLPDELSYGLDKHRWPRPAVDGDYWLFLHGTTWVTKLWPEVYWRQLAEQVIASGRKVILPWGNDEEKQRAERIAQGLDAAEVLPKMGLDALNAYLAHAQAVVGVDTGLSHVVAALSVPAVAIYGATDAKLTGVLGPQVTVMSSERSCAPCLSKQCLQPDDGAVQPPCYRDVPPQRVFEHLNGQL
ncbi:lipopolysaccharide heptosyltransferase I [Bacterioplanes sanyensis]|uniref:Lipopolysaccharide heptosyltransferase 1 n=1 Tax=Bacterioplanes sanyensis TaxID=1249553 RepID=A0A222FMX7_9GAMM|nr:lipopolysaccharide heptosyltransferase I [Bacterioplanes sanyensis]ASP40032.1 lipopolysaccharide heptosyltransferase I [Bacterioplanes sanyensis]